MQGLSLLELLVAFVIMAFSLTALYRATGSAVRSVSTTEQHWRAATLAQSLLESRDSVAAAGWHESGEGGGLQWQVHSAPYPTEVRSEAAPSLHQVEIVVRWTADGRARQLAVNTLLPQSRTPPGGVIQ
jgi:general secretion pathway protein I